MLGLMGWYGWTQYQDRKEVLKKPKKPEISSGSFQGTPLVPSGFIPQS